MAKCLFQSGGGGGKSKLKVVTATANDVLKGKIIVDSNGKPLTGTIESMNGQTATPSNSTKTVACKGKYMAGDISIKGDANLVATNIVSGKTIFGVAGNMKKFAFITTFAKTGTDKKTYNIKNESNSNSIINLYHADIELQFNPASFMYLHIAGRSYPSSGFTLSDGRFYIRSYENTTMTIYLAIDKCIKNEKKLFLPSRKSNGSMNICATGYY